MKTASAFGAVLAILATPTLFATPLTVTTVGNGGNYGGYGPYQTGVGGEFTLYSPDLASIISSYYSGAQNQWNVPGATPNFQTFCVEGDEYIYPNTTSDVTMTGVTMYTGDTLSKGAAYLYAQFASGGNFGGNAVYNYGANRSTTAAELQNAIWSFMGNQEGQYFDPTNPFEAAAAIEFGGSDTLAGWNAADAAGGAGYDGVYILNLWNPDDPIPSIAGAQQDQLIWVSGSGDSGGGTNVPDAGSTLILSGIGLSALALYRRRLSSAV